MLAVSPISISSASTVRTVRHSASRSAQSPLELASRFEEHAARADTSSYFPTAPSIVGRQAISKYKPPASLSRPTAKKTELVERTPTNPSEDVWEISEAIEVDGEVNTGSKPKIIKVKSKSRSAVRERKQMRIEAAKVTKPGSKTADRKGQAEINEPLELEKCLPRRRDWTPPKSRTTTFLDLDRGSSHEGADSEAATPRARLQNVLGGFGYSMKPAENALSSVQQVGQNLVPPLKRRKLDLVEAAVASKSLTTITKKNKAPKKARTITALATEDFRPNEEALTGPASLLTNFLTQQPSRDPERSSDDEEARLVGAFESDRGRGALRKVKSKAVSKAGSRLYSPRRAIEAAGNQDLLFGTSSQLQRDESPDYIRDLQHALKESETSASQEENCCDELVTASKGKDLWSAATRNFDGSLLEAEAIDLTTTPRPGLLTATSRGPFSAAPVLLSPFQAPFRAESSLMAEENRHFPAISVAKNDTEISLPKSMAEAACKTRPRSKSPIKKKEKDMTDFNNWKVPDLSKKIKSYGFKPVKGKAAMVALLQKCEEGTQRQALQQLDNNTTLPSPRFEPVQAGVPAEKTKKKSRSKAKEQTKDVVGAADDPTAEPVVKKRGRPKKADSDAALAPKVSKTSTKAAHPRPAADEPQQSAAAACDNNTAATGSKAATEAELLEAITKAVTTFPPTHDIKNLTWHEKMLMYDPIVIEDLTTWLNTEGLGHVAVDEEVWPSLVRTWCEDRSVCCLWRENLRGGKRARY